MRIHDASTKLVCCVCLAAWLANSAARAEDDFQKLKGRWRVTTYVADGVDSSDVVQQENAVWVFEPPYVRLIHQGVESKFKTTFDSESQPKQFDAEYAGDNPNLKAAHPRPIQGIYEIKGNGSLLRRCFATIESGKPRPKEFDAKRGSGNVIIVLERISPERNLAD